MPEKQSSEQREPRQTGRRTLVGVAAGMLVLGMMGYGIAITFTDLGTEFISVFTSSTADSNFNVDEYRTTVKGSDRLTVRVTLTNTDTVDHSANVTVTLLNSTSAELASQSQLTGIVAGGDSVTLTYDFQGTGLASEYDSAIISVRDES